VEVVELFVFRRPSRRRLDPQAYQALHRDLLEACRAEARAVDAQQRVFFEDLEELARPWLTLRVLQQADQEILFNLLDRCREAEWQLMGRAWIYRARGWARPVLAGVAVMSLVLVGYLAWGSFGPTLVDWLQDAWIMVWLAARRVSGSNWWLVGGLVLVAGLIYVVSRAVRG
jgi:hypothetical protein